LFIQSNLVATWVSKEAVEGGHNLWRSVAHVLPQEMLGILLSLREVLQHSSLPSLLVHPKYMTRTRQPSIIFH